MFTTDNFYAMGKPKLDTVVLQAGKTFRNGIRYNKISFGKAVDFLTMKRKFTMRPNSDICMQHIKVK